jgi:hypothetical protein
MNDNPVAAIFVVESSNKGVREHVEKTIDARADTVAIENQIASIRKQGGEIVRCVINDGGDEIDTSAPPEELAGQVKDAIRDIIDAGSADDSILGMAA